MSETEPVVYLIDDDAAFLKALSRLLRVSHLQVKAFSSAKEFLGQLEPGAAGCVVVDLHMPGMSGLELQAELRNSCHPLPVVFLTGQGDIPSTVRAMRDGAEDFLQKLAPKELLLGAIKRALSRNAQDEAMLARKRGLRERFDLLTERELEVLSHVVRGRLNKQIADDLGVHERTVKAHRTAITTKLGVPSVAELTRLSMEAGLFAELSPP